MELSSQCEIDGYDKLTASWGDHKSTVGYEQIKFQYFVQGH